MKQKFNIVGSAFGHGAKIYTTGKAPEYLRTSYKLIDKLGENFNWHSTIDNRDSEEVSDHKGRNYPSVIKHNIALSQVVSDLAKIDNELCIVIGGDHSCGIGTWSGVIKSLNAQNNFGLIWLDAHMDAHTFETSPSKSYHGMPLSVLLGKGDDILGNIGLSGPKIKPENLVLIGVRSFEDEEKSLLENNGVKIFYLEDVKRIGVQKVFEEALQIATNNTKGFGISVDLDVFDPQIAPGVGSPEQNGLMYEEVNSHLHILFSSRNLKCLEITEFNPELDEKDKTADILYQILQTLNQVNATEVNDFLLKEGLKIL